MSPILGIFASGANVAAGAFESIATATGTGSSGTITFSSIPGTYQHLQIRFISKSTQGGVATLYPFTIRFNGDTSANYAYHQLRAANVTAGAFGTADASSISSNGSVILNSSSGYANMHTTGIIDIHDYASTSKNKTLRMICGSDPNTTASVVSLNSGLWFNASIAAITSIDIIVGTGSWTTTSQFALYGIKGA